MKLTKRPLILFYFLVAISFTITITYYGFDYYTLPLKERFYSSKHQLLNPSGEFGHLFGIVGSVLITFGVLSYVIRKRWRKLIRFSYLKYWLEFHIFLCSLGSLLILFHTAFKFGGIISIGFWSLAIVVTSGIVGRVIYIQIPRTLQGDKLAKSEIEEELIQNLSKINNKILDDIKIYLTYDSQSQIIKSSFIASLKSIIYQHKIQREKIKSIKKTVEKINIDSNQKSVLMNDIKKILSLQSKIVLYNSFEILFKQWHIFHLPFAITMFFLMILHIIIVMIFRAN
ncbi:MAG: hypothetical protein N2043_03450 [Ignavibacterium sp.]|nr:hypothetical protein [Ignavibacterium sp.]